MRITILMRKREKGSLTRRHSVVVAIVSSIRGAAGLPVKVFSSDFPFRASNRAYARIKI